MCLGWLIWHGMTHFSCTEINSAMPLLGIQQFGMSCLQSVTYNDTPTSQAPSKHSSVNNYLSYSLLGLHVHDCSSLGLHVHDSSSCNESPLLQSTFQRHFILCSFEAVKLCARSSEHLSLKRFLVCSQMFSFFLQLPWRDSAPPQSSTTIQGALLANQQPVNPASLSLLTLASDTDQVSMVVSSATALHTSLQGLWLEYKGK